MKNATLLICGVFLFSTPSLGTTLSPAEFNECIYSYWSGRVSGALVDARAAHDTAIAGLYPSLLGSFAAQNDYLAVPQTHPLVGAYVTLNQQIINISQWATIHAKNLSERAAQIDFEDQLLTLMKAGTKTYFENLQSHKKLQLLQKRISRLEKAVVLAKEMGRLRIADTSSVFLAKADKVQVDILISNTQAELSASLNVLQASIGLGKDTLELDDDYNPVVSGDLSYWSKKIEEFPAIQVLRAKADANDAAATAARDQVIPVLSLGVTFGQLPSTIGTIANGNPSGSSAEAILSLNFPIFDQGLRSIQAQQSDSQKSINEAQVLSKREELLAEIKNLLNQWQVDERVSILAKEQFDDALHGYDSLLTLFSFGKTSFVSVKNSEASLVDSEVQLESIKKKIVGEKTILELLAGYVGGRHGPTSKKVSCPIRDIVTR